MTDSGRTAHAITDESPAAEASGEALPGQLPEAPADATRVQVDDFEEAARQLLPKMVFDYYAGGAGDELTLDQNRRAFRRWNIRPRVLIDVSRIDLRTTVLGREVAFPILLAPTAFQRMAHPDGELATARAAASLGTVMVLSTISTATVEDVASTGVPRWFQLYVMKDRGLTASLVERAVASGYEAIVLTVDTPYLGRRWRDDRNRFALPDGIDMANLRMALPSVQGSGLFAFFLSEHDPSLSWKDVAWLRSLTSLPIVLKGVVRGDDARRAADEGIDAVVVSNHGGRQLDGAPATLDALPEVLEGARGGPEVLLDGGVRRGADVLRALALGARAVLVGRPYLWGLAVDGERGVCEVMSILREELRLAMALAGVTAVDQIDRSLVARAPGFAQEED